MGFLIALAVILFLLCLPISFRIQFNEDGLKTRLGVWLFYFPIRLFKDKKNKSKQKKKAKSSGPKIKQGGKASDFKPIIHVILEFIKDFHSRVTVKILELKITLASDDPCDLAINYGKAWASVGNLIPYLEEHFKIKNRDIQVFSDFTSSEIKIYALLEFGMPAGILIWRLCKYGIAALREYLTIKNQRKGGTKK